MASICKGYQQLTSLSASTALTVPSGANYAIVVAETQAVRYRDDGTAPTATVGFPLAVGVTFQIDGLAMLTAVRFIEQTAGAKINVCYYQS